MDRENARLQARTLLERWEREPSSHDAQIAALAGGDLDPVEMVGSLDEPASGEFLAAVAAGPVSKDVRKAARRGLHRLRASGREAPTVVAQSARPLLRAVENRLTRAVASIADGVGSRWIWLFVERSTGGGHAFGLVLNETVGMKGALVTEMTRRRFQEHLDDLARDSEIKFVDIPSDYARALVAEALRLNESTGYTVPSEFQTYRGLLGDVGEPPERALIYEYVNQAEIRLNPTYLQESAALMDEPEIPAWILDFHDVRPFAEQLRQADSSMLVLNEAAKGERMARVESNALRTIFTEEFRRGLRRRLEEAAYYFLRTDRELAAKRAVAAAIGLEQPLVTDSIIVRATPGPDQGRHPFAVALLQVSIAVANQLELSGRAGSVPRRTAHDPVD